jgi:TetR/AcrR family transcriptional repressor of nem operon
MTSRSSQGAETRLKIIQAAADLFHKQGVGATSPDEIIEASGTGKGQFYHYFKSKDGLVHEVPQFYVAAIKTGSSPVNYDIQSWEDLERWFSTQVELQRRFRMTRGCPFGTIGGEVTENDELIRQDLSLIFELVGSQLAAFFIREKATGRMSDAVNERQLADYCMAVAQGAMLLGKVNRDSQSVEATFREALSHLKAYAVKPRSRKTP